MSEPSGLSERVRALAGLVVVGASLGLASGQLLGPWRVGFFSDNAVPQPVRVALLICALLGAAVAAGVGGLIWVRAQAPLLPTVARLSAPLGLAGFLPGLANPEAWSSQLLELTVCLAGAVIVGRTLFRLHFSAYEQPWVAELFGAGRLLSARAARRLPARWRGRGMPAVVVLLAAGYAAYMAYFTVQNHFRFGTNTWDLGQFDTAFFNTLSGQPFRCPALIRGPAWSDLATHAHFAIWLLTPLYALHPTAETLLVLQALIVGAGAIPLYRFAARHLTRASGLVVASAYLLYPPLHGAQFFDFHFQPIAASFVLFAIDFLDQRRMRLFAAFFAASLACREDVSIGFATIGLYLLVFTSRTRQGALILLVSATYFGVMRFAIMPAFGSWGFADFYKPLVPEGQRGFGAVVVTLVTNPLYAFKTLLTAEKLRYALQILTPLAFLPLSRPRLWLSLVLGTLVTLLTSGSPSLLDIGFQYGASFVPYVFAATVLALGPGSSLASAASARVGRRAALGALALGTALSTLHFGAFPPREAYHTAYNAKIRLAGLTEPERERLSLFRSAVAKIPPEAIVAAGDHELPHVSNRVDVWNMTVGYQGADYLLFDPESYHPLERQYGAEARAAGWKVIAEHPRFVLLKKP